MTTWPDNSKPTQPAMTQPQIAALSAWEQRTKELAAIKEGEMQARNVAVDAFFPDRSAAKEGVNNYPLPNGYMLKFGKKLNYNLDKDNEVVDAALSEIEKVGNQGAFIADRLIRWKPDLSVTEYKLLREDAERGSADAKKILAIVDRILTISEGSPALELKEPKPAK